MNKILLLALLAVVFTGCIRKKKEQPQFNANDLPAMVITLVDGGQVYAKDLSGKTILIFFQPDCDHCQREATQIHDHIEAFKDYEMYFISTAALDQVKKFSEDYHLADRPSVHFAQTELDYIVNSIGSINLPSVFIFSTEGKLIRHFDGEVEIAKILEVL